MTVFVDTSALYALLDAGQDRHRAVSDAWEGLLAGTDTLVTTNYVLFETVTLVQNRLGMEAVRDLVQDILPILGILWIGEDAHAAALSALLATDRRRLSLVDCASFEVMRRMGIRIALVLDADFAGMGLEVLPSP